MTGVICTVITENVLDIRNKEKYSHHTILNIVKRDKKMPTSIRILIGHVELQG